MAAAAVMMQQDEKDQVMVQFLTMTEDRVDPEVALSLLDSTGYDLQRAIDMVYDAGPPVGSSTTTSSSATTTSTTTTFRPASLAPTEQEATSLGGGPPTTPENNNDGPSSMIPSLAGGYRMPSSFPPGTDCDLRAGRTAPPQTERQPANPRPPTLAGAAETGQRPPLMTPLPRRSHHDANSATTETRGGRVDEEERREPLSAAFAEREGVSSAAAAELMDRSTAASDMSEGPMGMDQSALDAQLAAALEQSEADQMTPMGTFQSEEEMLQQALRLSQEDANRRERADLRQQQEMELAESVLMDQMRERREREEREQAEILQKQAEEAAQEQARAEAEERRIREAELVRKRSLLAPEPAEGTPDRRLLMFRAPGGASTKRAFLGSTTVGSLYDFLDVHYADQEWTDAPYRLVSTMPKKAYDDRTASLQDAGITNQFALLVEKIV